MQIELVPSVPATPQEPAPTPSEPVSPEPAATPEPTAVLEPSTPAEPLYKMPDGRELTGAQVKEEYEKLLPDYTRKSQELAQLKGNGQPNITNEPEWKKPDYVPKSYAEIIEIAERQALERIAQASAEEERAKLELSQKVDADVATLKAKDPKLDENALFLHANKYGFRDLHLAYENMQEMRRVALTTEERVLQGVKKKEDPIATGGAPAAPRSSAQSYGSANSAGSAQEFLSRLKGK